MEKFHSFEHLLSFRASDTPDRTALIYERKNLPVRVTYRGLYLEILQKVKTMKKDGKTCLGILCDGTYECIVTIFASVLSGKQTVLLDENSPEDYLQEQIAYTDIDSLWGESELVEELTPFLTGGVAPGCEGNLLFFTSGTTQRCKAVVLTDRSLMASAFNGSSMLPLSDRDILLCMLPLNHVFGFVCSLLWGLNCGAAVAAGRGARHFLDDPSFFGPTVISAVPLLLGFLLQHDALNKELGTILVGAGACPKSLIDLAAHRGVQICFGYGLTETSSGVAMSVTGDAYAMVICPEDTVRIAPDGEILVEAPTCMMQGYYKMEEETREVLKDGVLYTGDLGRLDEEGRLHITGRKKEMMVLADGTKIFLPEYEHQLRRVLPDLEFAVIEKEAAPVLVIHVPQKNSAVMDDDTLRGKNTALHRHELQQKIAPVMQKYPRGQQIREIIFTPLSFPRTGTGKLRRWELQERVLSSAEPEG